MSATVDRALELTRRGVAQPSRRMTVRNALLACGIGASATYVAANVVGALQGGGYSSVNQSVSELTAIHASSRPIALRLFVASDVLALAFVTGVVAAAGAAPAAVRRARWDRQHRFHQRPQLVGSSGTRSSMRVVMAQDPASPTPTERNDV